MRPFPGKAALQQRVLPTYRVPFFETLAQHCEGGLSVCAGQPRPKETITTTDQVAIADFHSIHNLHFLGGSLYVCWQRGLAAWLARENPTALIVEANPRYLSTQTAINWMRAKNRPVIGWGLGAPPLRGPLAILRQSRRVRFLSQLDAIIAYSNRGAQQYRQLGLRPDQIFVAPNAVAPPPNSPPSVRASIPAAQATVLFVGRMQARKRLGDLLEACAGLPQNIQPKLLIVGDGSARDAFEQIAQNIYPQAQFLGARHGDELTAIFRKADLFVLPGTGGLAVQEAMSHGLPVIVAEGDGTQNDLVRPGNGWLVHPGNVIALRRALQHALDDLPQLRRMGQESYRIVKEEINIQTMAETFVAVLLRVTSL